MENTLSLFNQIVKELLADEAQHPVAARIPSDQLYEKLDLSLPEKPLDPTAYEKAIKALVMATPRTATKAFFNQLFGGRNEKAVLGDLLAVILNNSMYTYKAAGPQVGVEKVILRKVCDMIGWDEKSGGTIAPGGSMTNFMAMLMARDAFDQRIPKEGLNRQLLVYTSKDSHYSIPKNAAFSGIGRANVRYIPVDHEGRMDCEALQQQIEKDKAAGLSPMMVNLTAGTTVMGAFDVIEEALPVCQAHDLWIHLDGAYCGSVLFSEQYRHLIKGVDKVDSFSFNAHKMIGTPLTCSLIVVKDQSHLYESFSNDASYLYQTDHNEFNLGKTSLQCGRRNDALKFWTLWKSVGTEGLEKIVDQQFELANTARNYIRNHEDYTLYSYDQSISICFNYKDIPAHVICTLLYEHSELLVGYGHFEGQEFIRFVTINAQNENEDIIDFFRTLEKFVAENEELISDAALSE